MFISPHYLCPANKEEIREMQTKNGFYNIKKTELVSFQDACRVIRISVHYARSLSKLFYVPYSLYSYLTVLHYSTCLLIFIVLINFLIIMLFAYAFMIIQYFNNLNISIIYNRRCSKMGQNKFKKSRSK